jgi:hypothetical protein
MPDRPRRLPVSTRHAFALAFDLAARRDPLHSLVVPLLLRAPWNLAMVLLPEPATSETPGLVRLVTSVAMLGDFFAFLLVTGMLRFRARSVFNTPVDHPPAPAWECYEQGLRRMPWLFVTEIVRNVLIGLAAVLFVVPGLILGYKLSFATEAVVLSERDLASSFRRSFHVTQRRVERWLELIVASGGIVLALTFMVATCSVFIPGPPPTTWLSVSWLLVAAVTPIIQYAWTFFYLRLVEVEEPLREVGPAYAAATGWPPATHATPQLSLVEPASPTTSEQAPEA